ncbi:MAG: hypothetical protein BWK79_06560 [Beggiatoa sp. IS2]|nr:MAG: hypothetical protein BWK79_06560 [Beggiatoa sp. IS2]
MYFITKIPQTIVELRWESPLPGSADLRARQLRGAIAHAFPENNCFHQHTETGVLYRYPQIQYRWRNGYGIVVGWNESAETLLNLPWLDLPLQLGKDTVCVNDVPLKIGHAQFGNSERLLFYHFVTPISLFNQENYKKYIRMDEMAQRDEQNRLLIAQILIALRELGVDFTAQLYAAFTQASANTTFYKEEKLMGIMGKFVTNALLPSGFAMGRAVSHGYGWVEPI